MTGGGDRRMSGARAQRAWSCFQHITRTTPAQRSRRKRLILATSEAGGSAAGRWRLAESATIAPSSVRRRLDTASASVSRTPVDAVARSRRTVSSSSKTSVSRWQSRSPTVGHPSARTSHRTARRRQAGRLPGLRGDAHADRPRATRHAVRPVSACRTITSPAPYSRGRAEVASWARASGASPASSDGVADQHRQVGLFREARRRQLARRVLDLDRIGNLDPVTLERVPDRRAHLVLRDRRPLHVLHEAAGPIGDREVRRSRATGRRAVAWSSPAAPARTASMMTAFTWLGGAAYDTPTSTKMRVGGAGSE